MPGFEQRFQELLVRATKFTESELIRFRFEDNPFAEDELLTQHLTYIYSCTASLMLRDSGFTPGMTAGYSMGIYAALFDAGSVSFETGLQMISLAFGSLSRTLAGREFTMGTLIGLDRKDIQEIIDKSAYQIEITNQNASHSFVVSGYRKDVHSVLAMAIEEGALNTRDLAVSIPYHSKLLEDGALDFSIQISHLEINTPQMPIISVIDQSSLTTPEMIRSELVRNLYFPLNWYHTMERMLEQNVHYFIECGASKGLSKNARFIEGARNFYPLNAIPSHLG
jgi:[acyl-carrier-protein] S-malonyltransferase